MINLKLKFDTAGKVEPFTFILAKRDGSKIGLLTHVTDVTFKDSCDDAPELSAKIYQADTPYWDQINMFKTIYIKEVDTYFAIECDTNEDDSGVYKSLTLKRLAESELEQINVYGLQINTEEAIVMPDYDAEHPVVLYRPEPELQDSSLLHKILSFAPHYTIGTVDASIRNIQRIFTFDNTNIIECFKQIAEEESVIFDFECGEDNQRIVNVHDALSSCNDCGFRGHFTGACPICGSTNVTEGFGESTGICVSKDVLGTNLTITRNPEAINNCYHVAGGDDMMTAAIWNCNPNGGYVWSFSDEMKDEMSAGLKSALNAYEILYDDYQNTHEFDVSGLPLTAYNNLVNKYKALDPDVKIDTITSITGYSEIIKALYDAIDFGGYLNTSLMPSVSNSGKTATQVIAMLTQEALSPVSVMTTDSLSLSSASSAVIGYARILSDPLFDIKAVSQDLVKVNDVYTWVGVLSATNYYDKSDTAKTGTLRIVINNDMENYAQNSVMQTLLNRSQGNAQIINLYNMTDQELTNALKYYSYQALSSINDCYVKSVEMLTSIGANDPDSDAYVIYTTTVSKLDIIATELTLRESEVRVVDFTGETNSMVALLTAMKTSAMAVMKLENNLTSAQWIELNSFRRESDYSNDNYVSTSFRKKFEYTDSAFIADSLSNGELIKRAYEFLLQAEYKIAENNKYSYSINTSIQNLLVIDEFASLRDSFKCGNWIRVMDTNGTLYKLRLLDYEIDFENMGEISVNFSDIALNSSDMNQMKRFMDKTQDVVNKFGKSDNQNKSSLVNRSSDLTNDYGYSDAYNGNESYQNIEIMNNNVTTKFTVIDGLIQGKISAQEALSLIAQELGKITLTVQNGNKTSTITINYDEIEITSPAITLGGTVVFEDNLTDGQTIISGDNIITGEIKSANYVFRTGQIFSDSGSLFSLVNGTIRTKALYTDATTGDLYIKGSIYATGGRIGDYDLTESPSDSSYAVDHAHTAWKLRSAKIAGQNGKRYYVSLTKQRNLVVSDSSYDAHSAENDKTIECNIGTKKYPWRYGYFKRLYMDNALLGTEYIKVTLDKDDWHSTNHTITVEANGITSDSTATDKIKQYITIGPAYSDNRSGASDNAKAFYDAEISCVGKYKNHLIFRYGSSSAPTEDIDVYVYAQYARPLQDLDDPYNASIWWDEPTQKVYCTWYDPDDEMFSTWDHTVLVRKFGSEPTSVTDGDVLETYGINTGTGGESEKDKYSTTPFEDTQVASMTKGIYYYKIFAVAEDGNVTSYTDSVNTSDAPVIISVSDTGCVYEVTPNHYQYIKLVMKEGSAPESVTDGIVVGNLSEVTINDYTQQVFSYTNLPTGTLYFKIFAKSDNGNMESNVMTTIVSSSYDFGYSESVQTFVVPETGIYQLETWGAQGENDGGYGGYSVGEVELQAGDVLYIVTGGQNGYNGGGAAPRPETIFDMSNTVLPSLLDEQASYGNIVTMSTINSSDNESNVFPEGKNEFLGEYDHDNEPKQMVVNVKYKHLWPDIGGFRADIDGSNNDNSGYGYIQYSANSTNQFIINLRTRSNTIYGNTNWHTYNYTVPYTFSDTNEHDIKCIFKYDYNEQYDYYCVQSWELYVDNTKIGYDTLWINE